MTLSLISHTKDLVPELYGSELLVATIEASGAIQSMSLGGPDSGVFSYYVSGSTAYVTLRPDVEPDFEETLSYLLQANIRVDGVTEQAEIYVPVTDLMEVTLGTAASETVTGARGQDYIDAGAGDDTILGHERDDWMIGGDGNDAHFGHDGFDTVDYRYSGAAVTVDLAAGTGSGGSAEGDSYDSVERIVGSLSYGDTITGSAREDKLYGMGGDDTLSGGASVDYLDGGAGADLLDGGGDRDIVHYGESDAAVDVNLATGTGLGGDAEGDTLISIEKLFGSLHGDTLTGSAVSEDFFGLEGADSIDGGAGHDTIEGGAGADVLDGGLGIDTLSYFQSLSGVTLNLETGTGSAGDAAGDTVVNFERVTLSNFDDSVIGSSGNDSIEGLAGADRLEGGAGGDLLFGDLGNDHLSGGDGVDRLKGGGGDDLVEGDAGNDYLHGDTGNLLIDGSFEAVPVAEAQTALEWNLQGWDSSQAMTFWSSGHEGVGAQNGGVYLQLDGQDKAEHQEAIWQDVETDAGAVYTLSFSVALEPGAASQTSCVEVWFGGVLVQTLMPGSEAWETVTLELTGAGGTERLELRERASESNGEGALIDNVFMSTSGDDTLSGGAGNDTLYGDFGADHLDGGTGMDSARYDGSNEAVLADLDGTGVGGYAEGDTYAQIERLYGSTGFGDTLRGSDAQGDLLFGLAGHDTLEGRGGNDRLFGGGGNDSISGGAGNDVVRGDFGADVIDGGDGIDTVDYRRSSEAVSVNIASNVNTGGWAEGDSITGIERIHGTLSFADSITGGSTRELILGWGGDDRIDAGGGNDYVSGGEGNDSINGGAGDDQINDGDGDDTSYGGEGDDRFLAADGADHYSGDAGRDSVDYRLNATAVVIDLQANTASGGWAEGDTYATIEQIEGSQFDDSLLGGGDVDRLHGWGGADVINGRGGADYLNGGAGDDSIYGGDDNDVLVGATGNDVLEGDAGDDVLSGEAGNDTLRGGAGSDRFAGEAGADSYDGGDGLDQISFRAETGAVTINLTLGTGAGGNAEGDSYTAIERVYATDFGDTLTGSADGDRLYGFDGADIIGGEAGSDFISGGAGNDTLSGGAGNDILSGDGGDDTVLGEDGDDVVTASDGADHLDGGAGVDTVKFTASSGGITLNLETGAASGGAAEGDAVLNFERAWATAHNDVITGSSEVNALYLMAGDDTATGGDGGDFIDGGDGADSLAGEAGNDIVVGGAGDDTLSGGDGNDILNGGAGADSLDGGAGTDVAEYRASGAAVTLDIALGTGAGGDAAGDTFSGIERFELSDHNDSVIGSNGADRVNAYGGDDTLAMAGGADTVDAGAGNDSVDGGNGGDRLLGGAGDDLLLGGTGADSLDGGADDDILRGGDGNDNMRGGSGTNTLEGEGGNDRFYGGSGADAFYGGDGTDWVIYSSSGAGISLSFDLGGTAGDASGDAFDGIERLTATQYADTITGGGEDDRLYTLNGDDEIVGGDGNDYISAGGGNDIAYGGAGQDIIYAGGGDDFLAGDGSNDRIYGQSGNDALHGGYGDDRLDGGGGADWLSGSFGNDTLTGGAGADVFAFEDGWNADTITDFDASGVDLLDFSAVSGVTQFTDLTVTEITGGLSVVYGAGSVTLQNVALADLSADDFVF